MWHNKVSEAESWFEKALEQGYSAAESRKTICAVAYVTHYKTEGPGTISIYESFAESGDASDQYVLGAIYQNCHITLPTAKEITVFDMLPDYEKAAYWFKKAAEQGDPLGQCDLGECYLFGRGVEKNEKLGYSLLLKAAENNESAAARDSARQTIEKTSGMNYEQFVLKHT